MMNDYAQSYFREMLDKKRQMDAAWQAWLDAKKAYMGAQQGFLGLFPKCSPPGPIICGTAFVKVTPGYDCADVDVKFEYTEAERCPTSE